MRKEDLRLAAGMTTNMIAETGKEDATEHHDGTAAQYSLRNRSQYITDSWEK